MANISESFAHKMAPKTRWHRSGTKLRQCHPVTDVIPAILSRDKVAACDCAVAHCDFVT